MNVKSTSLYYRLRRYFGKQSGVCYGKDMHQLEMLEGRLLMSSSPVGVDDEYSVVEDSTLTVGVDEGVLDNDSDADGDALTAILFDNVSNGVLDFQSDGSFTYTPDFGYSGTDSFTYKARSFVDQSGFILPDFSTSGLISVEYEGELNFLFVNFSGGFAATTTPDSSPYTNAQITQLNLTIDDDLDLFFDENNMSVPGGALTFSLGLAGAEAGVSSGDFTQSGNQVDMTGSGVLEKVDGGADTNVNFAGSGASDFEGSISGDGEDQEISFTFSYSTTFDVNGKPMTFAFDDLEVFGEVGVVNAADDSDLTTVTITIQGDNDAPVAEDDAYRTSVDGTLVVSALEGVLQNDLDDGGVEGLSARLDPSKMPAHGDVTLNADGSFTYVPDAGYAGVDQFGYIANDGELDSNQGVVRLTIKSNPLAADDSYNAVEDTTLNITIIGQGVLNNDTAPVGFSITAEVFDEPVHGDLVLNLSGTFTYDPDPDYFGVDTFTYRAFDGEDYSAPATVTINISGRPDPVQTAGESYVIPGGKLFSAPLATQPVNWVGFGENWRYYDLAGDPGEDWNQADYDESGWKLGRAILGYGDTNVATTTIGFGGNASEKNAAAFFRNEFTLNSIDGIQYVSLKFTRDDAIALYLNGEEIYRDVNLADGAAWDEYATSGVGNENEIRNLTLELPGGALLVGRNVLAAEVHQTSPTSSDLRFDAGISQLNTGVLSNDYDPDGGSLESHLVTPPVNGTLFLNLDGTFDYIPAPGFEGKDSFVYEVVPAGQGPSNVPTQLGVLPTWDSVWKYFDTSSTNPGANWTSIGFNDSSWRSGAGELGYGDGDERTVIRESRPAAFFRQSFNITNKDAAGTLQMRLRRDDAAAVYLNGTQVYRDSNLPAGADHLTLATSQGSENGEVTFLVNKALLVNGENVIAVQVHQGTATSSDISFNLEMKNTPPGGGGTAAILHTATIFVGNDVDGDGELDIDFPEIVEDNYVVETNALLSVNGALGVLANDKYDGPLIAKINANPSQGFAQLNDDGSFTYVSTQDYIGSDSFKYFAYPADTFLIETPLVEPRSSGWRYLGNGSNQFTSWRSLSFTDTSWSLGTAPFGYGAGMSTGAGDTLTDFRSSPSQPAITNYFRKSFDVENPAAFDLLELKLRANDGVSVYLNGFDLFRRDLERDAAFNELATGVATAEESTTYQIYQVVKSQLRAGENVIAVEIHDASASPQNAVFDLEFTGIRVENRELLIQGNVNINVVTEFVQTGLFGDVDGNNVVDVRDIDLLHAGINSGVNSSVFDLNDDNQVNRLDVDILVHDIFGTEYGDINFDGKVDIRDLSKFTRNFKQSKFGWSNGDFNGDGAVNIQDLSVISNYFGFDNTPVALNIGGGSSDGEPAVGKPVAEALMLQPGLLDGDDDDEGEGWGHIDEIV